ELTERDQAFGLVDAVLEGAAQGVLLEGLGGDVVVVEDDREAGDAPRRAELAEVGDPGDAAGDEAERHGVAPLGAHRERGDPADLVLIALLDELEEILAGDGGEGVVERAELMAEGAIDGQDA